MLNVKLASVSANPVIMETASQNALLLLLIQVRWAFNIQCFHLLTSCMLTLSNSHHSSLDSCNGRYCGSNAECERRLPLPFWLHWQPLWHLYSRPSTPWYELRCTLLKLPFLLAWVAYVLFFAISPDICHDIECGSNTYCQDDRCVCYEGFAGDPNLACQPIYDCTFDFDNPY